MANIPKKSKDPTEVALTAIQDALDMRDGDPRNGTAAQREPVRGLADDDLFAEPAAPPLREERPARSATLAANDDRANIGQILQSLQRRPARTPYWIAGIFSGAWVICALGLAYSYDGAFATLVGQGLSSA